MRHRARGEPVRDRGRRRRVDGVEALREERADDAGQHVARAGGRERRRAGVADDRAAVGRATIVSAPLSSDDRAEALGAAARGLEPVRGDPLRSMSSSRASSPACGVSMSGARRARRLEPEEPVGVDDHRERRALEQLAHELARLVRAAEPGAERERRRRARGRRSSVVDRRRPLEAALDRLERERLCDGEARRRAPPAST